MVRSSWSRVGKAIAEALGYADGMRTMVLRILAWLALLGLPVTTDQIVSDQYLPLSRNGVLVWTASILLAFFLAVRAIYAKQKELDERADVAKTRRMELRKKAWTAMREVSLSYDRLRRFVNRERRKHARDRLVAESERQKLGKATDNYWSAANELPTLEASLHMHIVSRLQEALERQSDLSLLGALDEPMNEMLILLERQSITLDDPLADAERDSIFDHVKKEHPAWLGKQRPPAEP